MPKRRKRRRAAAMEAAKTPAPAPVVTEPVAPVKKTVATQPAKKTETKEKKSKSILDILENKQNIRKVTICQNGENEDAQRG